MFGSTSPIESVVFPFDDPAGDAAHKKATAKIR